MKVFFNPDCLLHDPPFEFLSGKPVPYYEAPKRILLIKDALERTPALFQVVGTDPDIDVKKHALEVHSADYLAYLETAYAEWVKDGGDKTAVFPETFPHTKLLSRSEGYGALGPIAKAGLFCFDLSCPITSETYVAATSSARVALSAAQELLSQATSAFALTRPPGHHAGSALSGGYCFLNNVAIAARYLQQDSTTTNIGVLDIDYHHGNGTQEIFYSDPSVLYTSIHASNDFPYFTGSAEEKGSGDGYGYNINFPLPKGTTDEEYVASLEVVLRKIENFGPEYLIVSLGVDTYEHDPISDFKLTVIGYEDIGKMIAGIQKPTLFVMEGGYNLDAIGDNVSAVLRGFLSSSRFAS